MEHSVVINGKKIYPFKNKETFLEAIEKKHTILIAINSKKILEKNPRLKKIINENIGYCDGVGAVIALHQKNVEAVKIAGAEFWLDIIQKYHHNKKFHIIGSSQEVIEKTIRKLKEQFSDIELTGYRNGFIDKKDKEKLIEELKDKKPDVVFVAQGTPQQEFLMDELIKEHPALYMGLGGSFDAYIGYVKRTPELFINLNLEWLYRFMQRPTRIAGLGRDVKFLIFLLIKNF